MPHGQRYPVAEALSLPSGHPKLPAKEGSRQGDTAQGIPSAMEGESTISVAKLTPADGPAQEAFTREARDLYQLLREQGYALISDKTGAAPSADGIPPSIKGVFGPAKRFFNGSMESKQHYARSDVDMAGYFPSRRSSGTSVQPE